MTNIQGAEMKTIFPCWQDGVKSYEKGGRVQCDVCGSFAGIKARNYRRNGSLHLFRRCASCGSLEVSDNWKGGILKQEIKQGVI